MANKQQALAQFQKRCLDSFNQGDYAQAQLEIDTYLSSGGEEVNAAGPLIDVGCRLKKDKVIERGVNAYEQALDRTGIIPDRLIGDVYYNLGNGYSGLFEIRGLARGGNYRAFVDNEYLIKATECMQKSIELDIKVSSMPSLYTNYANLLDNQGRYLEAIEYYNKALELNNQWGMAYGNKAVCILQLADISGDSNREAQYVYSYQLLKKALRNRSSVLSVGGEAALESFQAKKDEIEEKFRSDSDILDTDIEHPDFDKSGLSNTLKQFYSFASEHNLFLNLHVQDRLCEAAMCDPVFIHIVSSDPDDEPFRKFADWINEIKESYAVARYLLFESKNETDDKDKINDANIVVDTLDYSVKNLYSGLKKAAIKEAFGVLDKTANFLNEYLGLGEKERDVSWATVWRKGSKAAISLDEYLRSEANFHEVIKSTQGYTLFALFSLYLDTERAGLRDVRHALVHRKISVKWLADEFGGDAITGEELEEKAIQLLRFARHAVIYLVNFVNSQERQKSSGGV